MFNEWKNTENTITELNNEIVNMNSCVEKMKRIENYKNLNNNRLQQLTNIKQEIRFHKANIKAHEDELSDSIDEFKISDKFYTIPIDKICSILSQVINKTDYSIDLFHEFNPDKMDILKCNTSTIKYFIEDIGIDSQSEKGAELIYLAAIRNRISIYEYLLSKGYTMERLKPITMQPKNYIEDIFSAAEYSDFQSIRWSIENVIETPYFKDAQGNLLIHVASYKGNTPIIQYFIEFHHVSPNIKGANDKTPIHYACENSHFSVCKYLISKGSQVLIHDSYHKSPLHYAQYLKNEDILLLLITKLDSLNDLPELETRPENLIDDIFEASRIGRLTSVQWICQNYQALSISRNKSNDRPIHIAAKNGNLPIVRFFIEHEHVDIKIKGSHNKTPLQYANENNHKSVSSYLNEQLAKLDPPIFFATKNGDLNAVQSFIEKDKVNIEITNKKGLTPLQSAVKNGHLPIVQYLIDKYAKTDVTDSDGNYLIHIACKKGCYDIVKYFIENSIFDTKIENSNGEIPLVSAIASDSVQIFEYLLQNRASKSSFNLNEFLKTMKSTLVNKILKHNSEHIMGFLIKHRIIDEFNIPDLFTKSFSIGSIKIAVYLFQYYFKFQEKNEFYQLEFGRPFNKQLNMIQQYISKLENNQL